MTDLKPQTSPPSDFFWDFDGDTLGRCQILVVTPVTPDDDVMEGDLSEQRAPVKDRWPRDGGDDGSSEVAGRYVLLLVALRRPVVVAIDVLLPERRRCAPPSSTVHSSWSG